MNTESIMSREVITISNDAPIIDAYRLMKEKDIRHLPVVDTNKKVIGMLSDRDVNKAMVTKKMGEYYNEAQIPAESKVSAYMNFPVYTIDEKADVKVVAEMMIKEKISSLIVLNSREKITGIITTTDMLAYILQTLEKHDNHQWTQWTMAYYLKNHK